MRRTAEFVSHGGYQVRTVIIGALFGFLYLLTLSLFPRSAFAELIELKCRQDSLPVIIDTTAQSVILGYGSSGNIRDVNIKSDTISFFEDSIFPRGVPIYHVLDRSSWVLTSKGYNIGPNAVLDSSPCKRVKGLWKANKSSSKLLITDKRTNELNNQPAVVANNSFVARIEAAQDRPLIDGRMKSHFVTCISEQDLVDFQYSGKTQDDYYKEYGVKKGPRCDRMNIGNQFVLLVSIVESSGRGRVLVDLYHVDDNKPRLRLWTLDKYILNYKKECLEEVDKKMNYKKQSADFLNATPEQSKKANALFNDCLKRKGAN